MLRSKAIAAGAVVLALIMAACMARIAAPGTPFYTPLSEGADVLPDPALPAPTLTPGDSLQSIPTPHLARVTQAQNPQGQGVWTNYWLPGEPQGYIRDIVIDGADRVWVANPAGVHVLDTDDSAGTSTWTTYTTADGLPNDWASALAIDENGHVWVGTRDGIGVFDGSAWITYTTADGLGGSWVKAIAIDGGGQVWVGVDDKLFRFDGKTPRAKPQDEAWRIIEGAPTGVVAIDFDKAGRVWVGHQQGISVLDGTSWTHYTAANDFALHFVNDVTIDPEDNVWVSNGVCLFHSQDCTNIGLSRFDGQSWINYRETYAHNNNSGDLVYEIAVDEAGNVWVGIASGVTWFDGQSWTTYTQADGLAPDSRYGGGVYAVAIDSMGRKWLGSQTALTRFGDTLGAEMVPSPPQPRVEISAGPGGADSQVVQVGTEITLTGVPVGIGMPYYTLYLNSQPALTVTYNGQITYQQFPDVPVTFASASASNSRVEFTLQVVHPGTVELSIGATGEVQVDYGDGSGAWSWGGATSDSIAVLAVSVVSTTDSLGRK